MKYRELNIDGLVGPTHHYAGLAYGNEASMTHTYQTSYPRAAALQGLKKMKMLTELGLEQAFLPPPVRPHLSMLDRLGFHGSLDKKLAQAFKMSPRLLSACYSASSMWAANAATVSPAPDTQDGKVHFTPANMVSQLHRAQESAFTARLLQLIFKDERYFTHHPPLPPCGTLSDEGAANTNRLCAKHGQAGLNIWVYGRSALNPTPFHPLQYPARQTLEAFETLARIHGQHAKTTFFAQQTPHAIDAGVFHNDVISLSNECVFLVHEDAYFNQPELLKRLTQVADFDLHLIEIPNKRLSLNEAVSSYFFNSQLVTLPNNTMTLLSPIETQQNPNTEALIQEIIQDTRNPIQSVQYINLKQSMNNGGGPACLRLRVVLSEEALRTVHAGVRLTPPLFEKLEGWVNKHYREKLEFKDLCDPALVLETQCALRELEQIIKLPGLYPALEIT